MKRASVRCWNTSSGQYTCNCNPQSRGKWTEKILEEITEKFTTLMKTINQSISLSVAENQGIQKEKP